MCGGNLASKVTSAGFLDLVVTACHLGVDEEATSSGVGCLKVSATTCLVEWAAGRRKASAEIWVTDAAGAVTHPSSTAVFRGWIHFLPMSLSPPPPPPPPQNWTWIKLVRVIYGNAPAATWSELLVVALSPDVYLLTAPTTEKNQVQLHFPSASASFPTFLSASDLYPVPLVFHFPR